MVALWIVFGLILAAAAVSALGAAFSIFGLRDLFAGAAVAVIAMGAALEFAKFVLAAYLHQAWKRMNPIFKTYLVIAVVLLSTITSLGIFGFLSNAYQSASGVLEAETIKLDALKGQETRNTAEIARLQKGIDEIPATRVTKKMQARQAAEPVISSLTKQQEDIARQIAESNIKIHNVKQQVGPLIYISRAFKIDIDDVVKYLIILLVTVFDPLAICLVIATSEALEQRRQFKLKYPNGQPVDQPQAQPQPQAPHNPAVLQDAVAATPPQSASAPLAAEPAPSAQVIHMRFADEKERDAG